MGAGCGVQDVTAVARGSCLDVLTFRELGIPVPSELPNDPQPYKYPRDSVEVGAIAVPRGAPRVHASRIIERAVRIAPHRLGSGALFIQTDASKSLARRGFSRDDR